jgi:aspartyl-tRNA(Asn)/glutamyl-tRNA(Gln) amidotransferase subunit C
MKKVTLTKKDIQNLASLSKIDLDEKEVEKFTNDMETIISSVDTLQDFNVKNENTNINEIPFETLRNDEIGQSMTQEEALANAPEKQSGYFKVYGKVFDESNS